MYNNTGADRVFSLFKASHMDRAYARFSGAAAVITNQLLDGDNAVIADITCDLPAGIDALRDKLKLSKAIVAAYGLKVSADANVDQYDKKFYFSTVDGLQQTDTLIKDIATRVDANLQQRTQLIWPKIHQITEDCDFLATVKAGTTLVIVLQISEYPVVNFLPKAN